MMWRGLLLLVIIFSAQPATFAQQADGRASSEESPAGLVPLAGGPAAAGDDVRGGENGQGEMAEDQGGMSSGQPGHRVDMQGPAFVTSDHVYRAGQWLGAYTYSSAYLDGNRTGATRLTDQQALDFLGPVPPGIPGVNAYMMVPTHGTIETHRLSVMHGITDDLNVYVVPTWMADSMHMLLRGGATVTSSNCGLSDIPFGVLWRVRKTDADEVILNFGVSAPTGDIDGTYLMPNGMAIRFPYPMRLGHGTWDACPAITYRYFFDRASVGMQGRCDVPMGFNDLGYRVGNEYRANVWFDYLLNADKTLAATFRVEGLWRDNYVGADAQLDPFGMPGNDPNMRGGEYLNFGYGVSYMLPHHLGRLDFEAVTPIVQNVRGVQLGTDWALAARYLKAF